MRFAANGTVAPMSALGETTISVLDLDRGEIRRINYNSSDDKFTFYDENREPFGVTFDAGRDARERVETECNNTSFMVTYSELCSVLGSGTVETRGSRVFVSIEKIDQLSK